MKQDLLKNQILYAISNQEKDIENLNIAYNREKREISTYDYNAALASRMGALNALKALNFDTALSEQITPLMLHYIELKDNLKFKFRDENNQFIIPIDNDVNKFYFYSGASNTLMLLLTSTENPLSACPINKDILLTKSLNELEKQLEITSQSKDRSKIAEIKMDKKITKDLISKNLPFLENEKITN